MYKHTRCLPCGEQLAALFSFCQSRRSAPRSPERVTPLHGGRQAALFTFPRRSKSAERGLLSSTVSEPFLARCSWAIPRAALLCPPEALLCLECLSYRNEAILFCAASCSCIYFDINAIMDVELHRISGLCSLLCARCPASRGFACGSRKPVIG